MSAQLQPVIWTEQEYRDFEETSKIKHEFINGELCAMAGGTEAHADICLNITSAAKARLRGKTCKAVNSDRTAGEPLAVHALQPFTRFSRSRALAVHAL